VGMRTPARKLRAGLKERGHLTEVGVAAQATSKSLTRDHILPRESYECFNPPWKSVGRVLR
jgi:hypothetical protein